MKHSWHQSKALTSDDKNNRTVNTQRVPDATLHKHLFISLDTCFLIMLFSEICLTYLFDRQLLDTAYNLSEEEKSLSCS